MKLGKSRIYQIKGAFSPRGLTIQHLGLGPGSSKVDRMKYWIDEYCVVQHMKSSMITA